MMASKTPQQYIKNDWGNRLELLDTIITTSALTL